MLPNTLMPLDKIAELCRIIDVFSADAHFDYQIVRFAQNKQDLLSRAEEFDIKNEDLFNQFEAFLSGYKALVDALGISSESLSDEGMQELGDLTNTLETRYERLQNNGYLNVSADEGYEEEFDPADFRELIADMMEDANSRFQVAAGDLDISQLKGLEIARELNQEALDRGDDKMRWTGDKVQQQLEARQKHLDKVKFRRKFAKDSPEYQRLIETSRKNYRIIMADPERKEAYRRKARERQAAHWQRLTPEQQKAKQTKSWEHIRRLKDTFRAGGGSLTERLKGGLVELKKNLINVKMGLKKKVNPRIKPRLLSEERTFFSPLVDKISQARARGDEAAVKIAIDALDKALHERANKVSETEPEMVAYAEQSKPYTDYIAVLSGIVADLQKIDAITEQTPPDSIPNFTMLRDTIRAASGKGRHLIGLKLAAFKSHNRTIDGMISTLHELDRQLSGSLNQ